MIRIAYLQKFSLQDYPSKIACIIFLSNCNFRCGFCHNPELVRGDIKDIDEEEVLKFLEEKKNKLEGVVITGGEPLLDKSISTFLEKIKEKGYKIKVDTNGSNPAILREIIDKKLLDYVALDIKTSKEKYERAINCAIDLNKIEESIKLIINSGLDYEFRTTVVPDFVEFEDIKKIKLWINSLENNKLKAYYLQQFNNKNKLLDEKFKLIEPYEKSKLESMKELLKDKFEICEIRA